MIPFALMTADGRSTSLNAQRLINMYAEKAGAGAKTEIILRSTPGLEPFSTNGSGAVRGLHKMNMSNAETLFAVIGNDLYEIDSGGTGTLRGAAGTIAGTGFVSMESNAIDELMIANSAGTTWLWDNSTLATVVSYDADFTDDATSLAFLDQYFLFTKANTGQVHAFDLNTGKSYDPLSFATAEASPDNAVQVYSFGGNLWVFGVGTTEVWYNAATSPFPFARLGGVVFEDIGGVLNTVADVDNAIHFLGGDGFVYSATQFQPQRISTHDIENRIRGWTNHYAFTYKDEGHAFYVLGADQGCVVFDRTTGFWHERESFTVGRWRANSSAFAYGKHLVGDYLIGRVYEMSLSNYADGANALQRRIISPPLYNNGAYMSVPWLQVNFEHGVGLTSGQGSDPQVIMDWSNDGGKTYGNEHWASIGKIGGYRKRAVWRRTGRFRERVYRMTYTDPTVFVVYGASM